MGQGRKKAIRSEKGRCRRRSISYEMENTDASSVMRFIKAHSPVRTGSFSIRSQDYCREATPVPSLFSPIRHDSLVDYISSTDLPLKSPDSVTMHNSDISSLPLISTSPAPTKLVNESINISNRFLLIFH